MSNASILICIALPLLGGLVTLTAPLPEGRIRNVCTEAAAIATSLLVWAVILAGPGDTVTVYSFTHASFYVAFQADGPSMFFAGMVSLMWPLVLPYAFEYMSDQKKTRGFFSFYLMTYGITLGVAFSANLVTMYVFFEMLTLITIPLVSYYQDHDSMFAGRKYAAYCIGGASMAFISVVMATLDGGGDFVFEGDLGGGYPQGLMRIIFLFGFFGFGTKAAIFPFFSWLPEASVAPTPVTALLHAVAVVNSGVFAVMRLTWYVFGPELLKGSPEQLMCLLFSEFTLVFAAVMALKQRHFKRRLAYSTVSNLSYMLTGIILLNKAGLVAGMLHMLFHGVIKMSLFLCAGSFMHVTGREYIYEVNGAGRRMPLTFICYTLGALSLTGIPLFCGFVSKWRLLEAAAMADTPAGTAGCVCLIISAFFCAMYTLTVSVRAFFPFKGTDLYEGAAEGRGDPPPSMLLPVGVFTVLNAALGIWPEPVIMFLERMFGC